MREHIWEPGHCPLEIRDRSLAIASPAEEIWGPFYCQFLRERDMGGLAKRDMGGLAKRDMGGLVKRDIGGLATARRRNMETWRLEKYFFLASI